MADTITTREFRDADLESVLDVMRLALGETSLLQRTPESFAWKHFANPFGRSIILVAESGGDVVGLRAFMRWTLVTPDGATLRAVRAVDTATHPEFRRRGIFRRLTLEAVEAAAEDGVHLVFNTPNPASRAGYVSMGWQDVGPIGVLLRPSRRMLRRTAADDDRPAIEEFLTGATAPATTLPSPRPPRGLRTPRTDEYARWRFAEHPTATYVTVAASGGVAVLRPNVRNGRRELVVSELAGSRPGAAVRAARRRSRAGYLVAWFSRGTPERRAALSAGLLPIPRVKALSLVARPLAELPVDPTALTSWDLALSDLELL